MGHNIKTLMAENGKKAIVSIPGWVNDLAEGTTSKNASSPVSAWSNVPLLFRAVNLRCQSISSIPFVLFKNGENVGNEWPFEYAPLPELIYKIELGLLLTGAAYVLKKYDGKVLTDLQCLNPTTVTWKYKNGQNIYTQKVGDKSFGPWTDDEVVSFREPSMTSDVGAGVAPASVALQSSKLRFNMDEFAQNFFSNGGQPVTLITTEGNPSQAEMERAQNFFRRSMQGVANAWRTIFLRGDLKVTPLTPDLSSMEMYNLNQHVVLDIGAALGIPRSVLESDAANYATSVADMRSFWENTVRPRIPMFEDAINNKVFAGAVDDYRLVMTPENLAIFQEDEKERSTSLLQYVQAGVPLSKAMAMLGLDPTENLPEIDNGIEEVEAGEHERPPGTVEDSAADEMRAWRKYELKRSGKPHRPFKAKHINQSTVKAILSDLKDAGDKFAIEKVFDRYAGNTAKIQPGDIEAITRVVDIDQAFKYLSEPNVDVLETFGRWSLANVLKEARRDGPKFRNDSQRMQEFVNVDFAKNMTEINETTRRTAAKVIQGGIDEGLSYKEMARNLEDEFGSPYRKRMIVRTQVGHAANFAIDEGMRQSGIVSERRWVTSFLDSRKEHIELSGATRGLDEAFTVADYSAMLPGEFGEPEMDINCRCVLVAAKFTDGTETEYTRPKENRVTKRYEGLTAEETKDINYMRGYEQERVRQENKFEEAVDRMFRFQVREVKKRLRLMMGV